MSRARHAAVGHRWISVALVLVATSLFGTIGTARVLGPPASSASVGSVRLLLGATLLLGVAAAVRAAADARRLLRHPATWIAGGGQAAFQVTFLSAVERTGVAVGTLVAIGSAPIVSGLLTRHWSRVWVGATALSVAGLALLVAGGSPVGRPAPAGILLALGAGVSYASYTVATKHAVARGHHAVPTAAGAFGVAALLLAPALALTDLRWLGTAAGAAMVGYLGVVATVVAYLLFTAGLRGIPAATANTLGLAEPLVATLLGVVLLGERLTATGWAGAALVLAGLAALARSSTRGGRESSP